MSTSTTNSTSPRGVARSADQRSLLERMLAGEAVHSPAHGLHGRARQYQSRYENAFGAFIERLCAAGYPVAVTPGVRGGHGSATYRVVQEDEPTVSTNTMAATSVDFAAAEEGQ